MRISKGKGQRPANSRLANVVAMTVELMEQRVLMSTTVAAWNFDALTVTTTPNLNPATSSGTGTALSIGLQTSSGSGVSPAYPTYANANASGTGDISDVLNGTGNNPSGNQADHSSTGATSGSNPTGTNPAWRLRGSSDGWSDAAAVASQGAQFTTSTVGDSGISASFDLDPSSGSAPAEIAVQYTTDGSTWTTVPAADLATPTSATGATTDVSVATGTGGTLVTGGYYLIANSTTTPDALFWQNDFSVNLSGITGVNNNANFGLRIVNAATGASETEVSGAAYPVAGAGNWRLDNIVISATGGSNTAPSINTNPTNQVVSAGQQVTFTSAASGTPTPTVQWYEGGTPATGVQSTADAGGGTLLTGDTSPTLTFTTSSTAADNGFIYYAEYHNSSGYVDTTAATLTDALAAPAFTTQPVSVSTTVGTAVTYTAVTSGSPDATIGWQVSTNGGTSYSPITSGVGGYTISSTSGPTSTNGTLTFTAVSAQNNYKYEAVASNSVQSNVLSNAASLTLGGTVLSAWNFSNSGALINGQTVLNPAPSAGTGTSNSLGFGSVGTYSVYPGNPAAAFTLTVTDSSGSYTTSSIATGTSAATIQTDLRALHPATTSGIVVTTSPTAGAAAGVLLTGDTGATLTGTGTGAGFFVSLDAQATAAGLSTTQVTGSPDDSNIVAPSADGTGSPNIDAANVNAWRLVGTNGWNSNAPIGTQGAQFLTSTSGFSSVEASFDLTVTAQGEAKMQVEYTTDGSTWINVPAADLSVGSGDTGIAVANNTTSPNTVNGGYFLITAASSNTWYNDLGVNLTGISAVNNDANFGIRIVNAATGADCVNLAGAALNNSSGNDRLGDVQITGNNPVAPVITTNPVSQSVANGSTATFTAAAFGFPAPTVQWEVSTNGGTTFTPDTTDTGNMTTTLQVVASAANQGYEYEAVFSNTVGSTPTTEATLNGAPVVTTQPLSQAVAAGTAVTLTSVATGNPTPVQTWQVAIPNGSGGYNAFTTITSGAGGYTISGNTLKFTAEEGATGNEYQAVFTNTQAPGGLDSSIATVTVVGTPIAQWNFTGGEAPPTGGSTSNGTGNAPYATFGPLSNTAGTFGLNNDYTGIHAFPESDILVERSTLNSSYSEYDWRIRSGNGFGPTGSPGTPEGWSQDAPPSNVSFNGQTFTPQGVQWDINTTGRNNITFQFDWNEGGISDMQPQYSPDGGTTWINVPYVAGDTGINNGGSDLIEETSKDFYGITGPGTTAVPIVANLQGIAAANNNPNFEFRLAAAYSPSLPLISDGNPLDPTSHGQYATGAPGAVNAQQVLQFNSGITNGEMVPLTYNGTTVNFAFNTNVTTLIANLTTAMTTLVGAGNFSILPTNYTTTAESSATLLQPVRDNLGLDGPSGFPDYNMTVTFTGTLAATNVANMTTTDSNVAVATWVAGSASGFSPYVDGGGAWQIGNISFNGDTTNTGGLGIEANPVPSITAAENSTATFTATAYSETLPVTAQWYVNGSPVTSVGTAGSATSGTNVTSIGNNEYTSTYTLATDVADTNQTGNQYYVVFTVGSSTIQSQSGTLTVVAPAAPAVIIQPANTSVQGGNVTTISATATGAPAPTVTWQVSTDGGNTWSTVSNSITYSGATTVTTTFAGYVATLSIASATGLNGYEYRAVFSNSVQSNVTSSPATLTVLTPETILTDWDFNSTYPTVTSAANSPDPYVNSPVPVTAGVDDSLDVGGTAYGVGFDLPYAFYDSGSGTDGNGAVNADDIVNSPGALNTSFSENTWRPRGGATSLAGGTPANGFSNFVPQYTQGVQFSVPTTGYNDVYVTMDWYATTSGELDAQEQYTTGGTTAAVSSASSSNTPTATVGNPNPTATTNNIATLQAPNSFKFGDEVTVTGLPAPYDGTFQVVSASASSFSYYTPTLGSSWSGTGSVYNPTWTNINNPIQAVSNDFYGATATGGPVPLLINVSSIPGAANNPNFGIRLVNAYDPYLSNTQTLELGDTSNFTLTFGGKTTGTIAYSANPTTMAANVQAALATLTTVGGASNVTVTAPQSSATLTITFDGALDAVAQPAIVATDTHDTVVYTPQYANALLVSGTGPNGTTTQVPAPYNGSKGNWRFDNIVIHGVSTNTLPGWLYVPPTANVTWNQTAETLTVNSGTATIIADPNEAQFNGGLGDEPIVTVASGASLEINPHATALGGTINGDNSLFVHLGGLTLNGTATADLASLDLSPITGGTIAANHNSNHEVLVIGTISGAVPTFSIAPTSTLDMEDNDLIVHQGALAGISSLIQSGRDGGNWDGTGITSSAAENLNTSIETYQLGVVEDGDLSAMPGTLAHPNSWVVGNSFEPLDANNEDDIIVKFTYTGDFNLDGQVNRQDSSIFGSFFGHNDIVATDPWAFGDTNGDGVVTRTDSSIFGEIFGNGTSAGHSGATVQL